MTLLSRGLFLSVALIGAMALGVSPALAAPAMPWVADSGMTDDFMWSDGGSDNGRFGEPLAVGNSLLFFPSNFRAESIDGAPDTVGDRLEVTIMAKPGKKITGVRIEEFGDYGIFDTGTVSASATLTITRQNGLPDVKNDVMVTNPVMPIAAGSGIWDGVMDIDLTGEPDNWTKLVLELDNLLEATSAQGSSSFIEKKFAETGLRIMLIPEPAAAGLLLAGVFGVMTRRR